MELTGKLIKKLPIVSGTGTKAWTKRDFIIETPGQYPKKVCFTAWGDKIPDLDNHKLNSTLKISFDLESREHNERWYTEAKAWKIEATGEAEKTKQPVDAFKEEESEDELPF